MSYFVPTRFVWRFGGRQVHLCGSFTRWVETIPMSPVEESPGVFAVVVHLPPGYHQYKFIVDGKWRHDETAPFMPDPLGNVNNWLFVRRVDSNSSNASQSQTAAPSLDAAQLQQAGLQLPPQPQLPPSPSASISTAQAKPGVGVGVAHPSLALSLQQQQQQAGAGGTAQGLPPALVLALQQQQRQQQLQQQQIQQQQQVQQQQLQVDVDMANADQQQPPAVAVAVATPAPVVIHNPKEPEYTRKKISDFLHSHTAYELIPESGKVVVLDVDIPIRQAFHALHDQDTASAPLWDSSLHNMGGVISASDFINILRRLRNSVSSGANPLSEAEMDAHTVRTLREQSVREGRELKPLVYVKPNDRLSSVVEVLFRNKCSMAPVLTDDPDGEEVPTVLHLATVSGVLACLMRHFRASLASLPLLTQPLSSLPLGTWSPDASSSQTDLVPDGKDGRRWKKLQVLHTVTTATPLTTALSMLLDTGVSALPVVDERRCLIDVYARSDITQLCRGNAYNRLQWEDVTVGQALTLGSRQPVPWAQGAATASSAAHLLNHPATGGPIGGLSAELAAAGGNSAAASSAAKNVMSRVHTCTKADSLRTVVERLSIPGVRRLIVVQPETMRVEGLVSLSDVAAYLFL